jgi:hypothetical protein
MMHVASVLLCALLVSVSPALGQTSAPAPTPPATQVWFVWPRARVGIVATDEYVDYDAPNRLDEHRVLVQTHIEF